jgi:hypothetical protein
MPSEQSNSPSLDKPAVSDEPLKPAAKPFRKLRR